MHGAKALVIGAGAAGLVSARCLLQRGFDVTILEKSSRIGGVWKGFTKEGPTGVYDSLRSNLPTGIMQFWGFPFKKSDESFTHHHIIQEYLESYCKSHGLTKNISFSSEVSKVYPIIGCTKQPICNSKWPKWKVR